MRDIDVNGPLEGVTYDKQGGIATITLDRVERGNSLAPPMQAIFRAIWADVRDDPAVRVAIVTAAGERHFCTGFDVGEAGSDDASEEIFVDKPLRESVFWSPYQNDVWKPVICAVNGTCVGGGHHFVVDADIVVASRNAKFVDAHVNVGMVGAIENIGLAKRLPLGARAGRRTGGLARGSALAGAGNGAATVAEFAPGHGAFQTRHLGFPRKRLRRGA